MNAQSVTAVFGWVPNLLLAVLVLIGPQALFSQGLQPADQDRDGLRDSFEQELLERFRPILLVDTEECAGLPQLFTPYSQHPNPKGDQAGIYGQVLIVAPAAGKARLELHYYHLWEKDCGRASHPLDAEHVAVLVEAEHLHASAKHWHARYWLAAAHQDTACDRGHGAKAASLGTIEKGVPVWISRGKHASFLSKELCRLGCGGDSCQAMRLLPALPLVHIGELDSPLAGATWSRSTRWPLAEKMRVEFTAEVIAEIERSEAIAMLKPQLAPVQAFLLGGNYTLDGLAVGGRHTEGALQKADEKTADALTSGHEKVRDALGGAYRSTKEWLRKKSGKK